MATIPYNEIVAALEQPGLVTTNFFEKFVGDEQYLVYGEGIYKGTIVAVHHDHDTVSVNVEGHDFNKVVNFNAHFLAASFEAS